MDVHALLRRLRAGESHRQIAQALQLDRKTVRKYRAWARDQGLLTGPLPDLATLEAQLCATFDPSRPAQNHSSLEVWRAEIQSLLEQGLGPLLIYQKLRQRPEFTGSESAVWRLVKKLRPPRTKATVRVETAPGAEAQVDFGGVGPLLDPLTGTLRKAWAFAMVLSWSRHMYVEFVFDQKVETWLELHRRAFEFFGGVPQRLVIDNLKAGILKASVDDPQAQRAYAECAEHYGFLIAACRPATPQHKGKVERGGVGYVQSSFVPLLPGSCALPEANRQVLRWVLTTAGQREHGTTHIAPLARFEPSERAALQSLPATAFDPAIWKAVKLHRDCHVVFEKSFYSAPCRLVGQSLWLRASTNEIRLFSGSFELVGTHSRATAWGQRLTHRDHLPPEKVAGLEVGRASYQARADSIGPATAQVVADLLAERPVDRSRTAGRILRLAEKYTPARLEAACGRGQTFGDCAHATLKRLLERGLDGSPIPALPTPQGGTLVFARSQRELGEAILQAGGGVSWN